MNLLQDIITYIRRIIKSPSDAVITDNLLIDYINRFRIMDADARIQLFDLKTKYQFQTSPGIDQYNMPLYSVQIEPGPDNISFYPVYQGFFEPAYVNGIPISFHTQKNTFFNNWPNIIQQMNVVAVGNGGATYKITFPIAPNNSVPLNTPVQSILRGHVDITGIIATGNNIDPPIGNTLNTAIPSTSIYPAVYITSINPDGSSIVVQDSGQFLTGFQNYGLLMSPGPAPSGYNSLTGGYSTTLNTINYFTGVANVTFPVAIPNGVNINAQCLFFQTGLPRSVLFNNNVLTFRSPPDKQYLVELDAYLTPAAFLTTAESVQFAYMSEYIARGAARKILSDIGDWDQFGAYEGLFKEQELLVWKRSQRQFTSTRTQTIYSQGNNVSQIGFNNFGNTI